MHRCGVPLHSRPGLPLSKPHHTRQCDRPIIPHATRAAHRCRPAASRRASQHPKPLQAAPARKPLASRSMMFLPQAKRGGVRRQPWCCLDLAATGRPLVLSREWERTAPHIRRCAKKPCTCKRSQRPTYLRTTRAALRCRPAASGQRTQHLNALQAAPARKPIASRSMMFLPQAKRGGVRGQPWCLLDWAATGRPLVLSREWERTAPHARATGKGTMHFIGRKAPCPCHGQSAPPTGSKKAAFAAFLLPHHRSNTVIA